MSQDPLNPTRRASRRRLADGEETPPPVPTNGNGGGRHGPLMSVASLLGPDQTLLLSWNGQPISIRYNPNRLTYRDAQELDQMLQPADGSDPDPRWLTERLLKLVVGWDLVVDQETQTPYELTEENLFNLPARFLTALLRAVQEAINPPEPATS